MNINKVKINMNQIIMMKYVGNADKKMDNQCVVIHVLDHFIQDVLD